MKEVFASIVPDPCLGSEFAPYTLRHTGFRVNFILVVVDYSVAREGCRSDMQVNYGWF